MLEALDEVLRLDPLARPPPSAPGTAVTESLPEPVVLFVRALFHRRVLLHRRQAVLEPEGEDIPDVGGHILVEQRGLKVITLEGWYVVTLARAPRENAGHL